MTITTTIVEISYLPSVAFEYRRDLPTVPALYFVLSAQRDVMYVGQTGNLRKRWESHQRAIQMQAGGYRIHWYRIDGEQERAAVEGKAISYFRPPWNNSAVQVAERRRVDGYIRDVAAYMEINPDDLVSQILAEWAYNRELK